MKKKEIMEEENLITTAGVPVLGNQDAGTSAPRWSVLLQDIWYFSTSERKNDVYGA